MKILNIDELISYNDKNETIETKKQVNQFWSTSRAEAKRSNCFFCKKDVTTFCNSHSVPAFVLKKIAENGNLFNNNRLIQIPVLDEISGIKSSGTFKIICNECDNLIFSEYENPANYKSIPSQKMLTQIALKNYLKHIYKKEIELKVYEKIKIRPKALNKKPYNIEEILKLDYTEHVREFNKAKRLLNKPNLNNYYLFYYEKLDYITPIAIQDCFSLIADFEGNTINNVHNMDPKYVIQRLHVCVFPINNHTEIMLFIDSQHNRYRNFYKQLRKKSLNEKLAAITYLIFLCSEDVFISPRINDEIINNKAIIELSKKTNTVSGKFPIGDTLSFLKEELNFDKMYEIPNILSEEYKIV